MIRFTQANISEAEDRYVLDALHNSKLSGDGKYTELVYEEFRKRFGIEHMLLTTSGTTALEMASILSNLNQGDEVIVPSFTFSSTANAFMLRGAKPVFCDIRKDTYNIDETLIEGLITPKTKAIYVVDYAGFPCEMDTINAIAKRYGLIVVEDAAQAVGSTYKGRYAGTLSEFGCYSFHETKNYVMGEGGGIIINDGKYMDRAEIIREKGTNRRQVLKGMVDKYTWHDIGSSFLPSDVLAAILYGQLTRYDEIMKKRMIVWNGYYDRLKGLEAEGFLRLPVLIKEIQHNAHMFNILLNTAADRDKLTAKLKELGIMAYISYVPLHSAPMGERCGYKRGMLPVTDSYGDRVLRLPLHSCMDINDTEFVCERVEKILKSI